MRGGLKKQRAVRWACAGKHCFFCRFLCYFLLGKQKKVKAALAISNLCKFKHALKQITQNKAA